MNHNPRAVPAPEELITFEQGQEYLKLSQRTLRRMVAAGELRAYRIGKRAIRLDRAEVQGLLKIVPTAGNGAA